MGKPRVSVCLCECVFAPVVVWVRGMGGAERWDGNEQHVRIWGDVSAFWGAQGPLSAFSSCNTEPAWLRTHLHPCGSHGKVINTQLPDADIFEIPQPAGVGRFQGLFFLRNPAVLSPPGKQNKMRA